MLCPDYEAEPLEWRSQAEPGKSTFERIDSLTKVEFTTGIANLELAKAQYLQLVGVDECSIEKKILAEKLRSGWHKYAWTKAQTVHNYCIAGCIMSNERDCYNKCDRKRGEEIDSQQEAIREFFRR